MAAVEVCSVQGVPVHKAFVCAEHIFEAALHKLEQQGWIKARWKSSPNNRRSKFYSLTRLGRKQLEKEAASWNSLSTAISCIVNLKEA